MIYLIAILAYLSVLAGIGIYSTRFVKDRDDFAVAGRTLSPWVMVLTMLACWIGTGSILGNAEKTYNTGLAAVFLPLGGFVGMILLSLVARRARNIEASTVPEIIGNRYGGTARGLAVLSLVMAYMVIVSYQFNAGGAVIEVITDRAVDEKTATLIAAIAIVLYASLAGLVSLAFQDIFTGIIMVTTMLIAVVTYAVMAGGWEAMQESFANRPEGQMPLPQRMQVFGVYTPIQMINFFLPPMLLVLGDANQYQRIFASRNARGAAIAVFVLIFASLVMELLIILASFFASSMIPEAADGRYVLIVAAHAFLPTIIGVLFMIAVVGIIISTANSFLLIPATSFTRDVLVKLFGKEWSEGRVLFLNRLMVVVFGAVAYGVSWLFAADATFLDKAFYAYTMYGASITPSLVAALMWKRATKPAAIVSIAGGAFVTLVWSELASREWLPWILNDFDAVLPALIVSVASLVVISLGTPPPAERVNK